jgi:large subunit ribosomal protein L28
MEWLPHFHFVAWSAIFLKNISGSFTKFKYLKVFWNFPNILSYLRSLKNRAMSKVCELTGKRPLFGHSVSHSNVKTKRKFLPNLKKKKFYVPELDEWLELKVSASAIRTINKKGIYNYLKELNKKGEIKLN